MVQQLSKIREISLIMVFKNSRVGREGGKLGGSSGGTRTGELDSKRGVRWAAEFYHFIVKRKSHPIEEKCRRLTKCKEGFN